jgi:hypothetical protein
MKVIIYTSTKSATQSGRAKTDRVIMECDNVGARGPEPLMGWTSASDTLNQIRLTFPSVQAAVDYAVRQGFEYRVMTRAERRVKPRNYVDNFKATLTIDALKSRVTAQESC